MHANTLNALRKIAADAGATVTSAGRAYINVSGPAGDIEFFSDGTRWHRVTVDDVDKAGSLAAAMAAARGRKTPTDAARAALAG